MIGTIEVSQGACPFGKAQRGSGAHPQIPMKTLTGPPRREVHRVAKFDRESDDEDLYGPPPVAPRRERRDGGSRGKSIRFEDEDEYSRTKGLRARADDDYDDPSYGGSPSRRDGNGKWVPQAEYDELSALCDNLLKQQEDMQNELAKATSAKGRGGKAGPTVRGVGPNGAGQSPSGSYTVTVEAWRSSSLRLK